MSGIEADEALQPAPTPPRTPLRQRFDRARVLARRHRIGSLVAVALMALALGSAIGRATAPGAEGVASVAVETNVLPLVLDADSIWTSGVGEEDPVSDAVLALSRDADPRLVEANAERWLEAYDSALVRMAGIDLPPAARPVQRQYMSAVTLSRDAVEVLARAAQVDDESTRQELITEVGRLRQRSEQLAQSARASTTDLDGSRTDVSPLPAVPDFG